MKKANPNIFYLVDMAGFLLLAVLMMINWNNPIDHMLGWEAGVGYSGYALNPVYLTILILVLVLGVYQYFLMKRNGLTIGDLSIEQFDETDEREVVLKNKLYRRIMQTNGYITFIVVTLIALFPAFAIKSSLLGIAICIYMIVRDIMLIAHNLKVRT